MYLIYPNELEVDDYRHSKVCFGYFVLCFEFERRRKNYDKRDDFTFQTVNFPGIHQ